MADELSMHADATSCGERVHVRRPPAQSLLPHTPRTGTVSGISPAQHVAILHRRFVAPILAGEKTIEARLSRARRAPFGRVGAGDTFWLKAVGGLFFARAKAERVLSAELHAPEDLERLRTSFGVAIAADDEFWAIKRGSRFATLIWLGDIVPIDTGPTFRAHPNDRPRDSWFVLDPIPDCVASFSTRARTTRQSRGSRKSRSARRG